jgi:hypothetical protein
MRQHCNGSSKRIGAESLRWVDRLASVASALWTEVALRGLVRLSGVAPYGGEHGTGPESPRCGPGTSGSPRPLFPRDDTKEHPQIPRELIEPRRGDKRFVRRTKTGQFKESDDVGRSLAADRRKKAKRVAKKGEGNRGDQRRC